MAGEKAHLAALIGRHDAALWQLFAKRQKFNKKPPVTVTLY
jgi:hypothetical protein